MGKKSKSGQEKLGIFQLYTVERQVSIVQIWPLKIIYLPPELAAGFAHPVTPSLPVLKIGSRLLVPKKKFAEWVSWHTLGDAD